MNGKAKGSAFERQIAKTLSLWLTRNQDKNQLIRSVLSGGWGGRVTTQSTEPWRQVGDLAPNGPEGERFRRRFAVECKHRRVIDLWSLWTRKAGNNNLAGWWEKLRTEAGSVPGLEPLLIFRANNMPIMLGITPSSRFAFGVRVATIEFLGLEIHPFQELLNQDPDLFLE